MFLKVWTKDFDFDKANFVTVPTWVKLSNIPTVYWSKKGIGSIASYLGRPLYSDALTESATRMSYARVCVEVSTQSKFPNSFTVISECNEEFEIHVEYEWIPKKCLACGIFGHGNLG